MNLYELTEDYRFLQRHEDDEQVLADTLESIDGEIEMKAHSICCVLREINGVVDSIKAEEERLAERRKAMNKRYGALWLYLMSNMEKIGKTKIETSLFTVSYVKGKDKVEVTDKGKIPMDYFDEIPSSWKLDKVSLLKALKNGDIEGAKMVKSNPSLRIK